eukprot:CAMPEP_0181488844 /NCGR_PEP_ID=MMETSP1110-20121109/48627_1 /TAXON_ID=174948 /ORGANISM="Symbiodinium sp., Strain CCMP421" /LENGTH=551 /DNA_ID=CAMNT_0023615561 /DNA_START=46 /DNA_END=1701 /DNA_ORIENTATION=+
MKINAKPRDEPVPRSHEPASQISENPMLSAPTNTSTVFESGIAGEAPRPEKLEVHVTSEDVTPNLTVIKMRPSMAFEKMMAAWCKQHHFARTSVRFEFLDGRELNGEECPASDGHPIQVRAVAEQAEASKPKVTIAKDLDETQPTESEGESIDVRVIAEGEAGENILHFKMKLSTSFGKMMGRWCTHHGVPQSEACFRVGDQELKEADTPASIGWAFGQDFTVRAVPRALQSGRKRKNQEEKGTPKAKRATSAYYLFMKKRRPELTRDQPNLKLGEVTKVLSAEWKALTDAERQPFAEEAQKLREAEPEPAPAPTSAAAPAAPAAPERRTVEVKVVAEGADGLSELRFNTLAAKPLERLMMAWCEHHELDLKEAAFLLGERRLKPQDTLLSLGCQEEEVVVQAVPREGDSPPPTPTADTPSTPKPKARKAKAKAKAKAKSRRRRPKRRRESSEECDTPEVTPEPVAGLRRSRRVSGAEGRMQPTAEVTRKMSFQEYLAYDREQEKIRNQARLDRQKRKLIDGSSSDEELHLAMALSLSESQGAESLPAVQA